ncbi:hypothetical protein BKA56DRAFT_736782 [Ilyonectria sp. MPI-CAGE-AT-0026]|nr:hypothetical protein BKA56DRAFT_736782 [Ilyonectria sp. MPI-CAGE-AT-0026]
MDTRPAHDDAISPLTDSSSPTMLVAASPMVSSPTDSALSRFEPLHRPNSPPSYFSTGSSDRRPIERKIDYDCFPEVVVSDDPEPTGLENQVTGYNLPEVDYSDAPELDKRDIEIYSGLEVVAAPELPTRTVTPLNLLGDQPEWIDCPFCERRTMTTIKRKPSNLTQ